jgi:hypothetical protein
MVPRKNHFRTFMMAPTTCGQAPAQIYAAQRLTTDRGLQKRKESGELQVN